MLFIIKLFPEITIKSKAVRHQMTQQLANNLKKLLQRIDEQIKVEKQWDNIRVQVSEERYADQVIDVLKSTPGITNFIQVQSYTFSDLHDIYEKTAAIWGDNIGQRSFAVRCKRVGKHEFNSTEIAQYVGGGLNQNFTTGGVNLKTPDLTINIEVRQDQLNVVEARHEGMGGFPLGTQDAVLSLISGGFDSSVSSYLTTARGLKTHYVFFKLGGRDHEIGVKEVAYYLWQRFGSSHKVKFITVPFEPVVEEILQKVSNSQMGVVLKRMFLRAATEVATIHKLDALVTGEAIAQVSSQTLPNLAIIDQVTDKLVLRPLITSNKTDIIKVARSIGTEDFAASMPEYCGVISVKPTTHARQHRIDAEEEKFDFSVLEQAIENAKVQSIEKLADTSREAETEQVSLFNSIPEGAVVIDIRHPNEEDLAPLELDSPSLHIPFYQLHRRTDELCTDTHYLLYCAQGVMSRLHAQHLRESGLNNVDVYRP